MPFSITCPSCSAKLKTGTAIPHGRSVQCPKCKKSFAISADNMEEVADSKLAVPAVGSKSAATKPAPPAPRKPSPPPAAENPFGFDESPPQKRNRDDDDEEERPRNKRRTADDDEPVSRSKRNRDTGDEMDDDRPRKRRRDEDDDEDDRPRARRTRDDDDDDAPRSRRRRDEDDDRPSRVRDDDDDDYDRPRKKKKKKKGNLGIKIGLAVFGLLALAGIGYLIYTLIGGDNVYDEEMIAFLPADSTVVAGIEVAELQSNAKLKELVEKSAKNAGDKSLKDLNEGLKPTGLTTEDFSRAVIGASIDKGEPTVVVRTKKSFDKVKMAEMLECKKEQKKGDKTYYSDGASKVVYFPSDTMFVMTNEKHFETIAGKDGSKVLISEDLQESAKKISRGHLWVAVSRSIVPPDMMNKIDMAKAIRLPYLPPELIDAVKDMKGAGLWAKADGDQVSIGIGVLCNKQESAENAERALQKDIDENKDKKLEDNPLLKGNPGAGAMMGQAKPLMESLQKSFKVDRSGAMVEMSFSFAISEVEKLANMAQPPMPQPVPPQPIQNFPIRKNPTQPPLKK